jgi:hypothetical protein
MIKILRLSPLFYEDDQINYLIILPPLVAFCCSPAADKAQPSSVEEIPAVLGLSVE